MSMDPKADSKMPQMVMCGDHLSFTKSELNSKEHSEKEKEKVDRRHVSYTRLSPTSSRTAPPAEVCARTVSEQALRLLESRRRPRSMDALREDPPGNKALLQGLVLDSALGSFRWPPYLLAVWVLVLLMTHLLHCLVNMLERALPRLRDACQYLRLWTERAWKVERDLNHKLYPIGLALLTALLYCLYFSLYLVYSVAVWSVEPLCDGDDRCPGEGLEAKVTNYEELNNQAKIYEGK